LIDSQKTKWTNLIKQEAKALGFDQCGISKAEFLEAEAPRLEKWLTQNMHGEMGYMANNFDKRLDPTKLVEGSKSVISLIYNYYPEHDLAKDDNYKIAKYAYGQDYHFVIKDKLKSLFNKLASEIGEINGRVFVDSAPVHERAWAAKSGLGWVGKNSLLLNQKMGSFFFLAEIILDVELDYDAPVSDHCGTCTKCIDACPTQAITESFVVDGSKCISYLTIELKNEIPNSFQGKFEDWVFGCDICQDVCPWNRFSSSNNEPAFSPHPDLNQMSKKNWEEITVEVFQKVFKKSPLKRTKFSGLKRNVKFTKK
jgi:epoxyqueuosine reductase